MKKSFALLGISLMLGCASGNCRSQAQAKASTKEQAQEALAQIENQNPTEKVAVFKLDGSLQCQKGSGVSLQEMSKQWGKIKFFKSTTKSDGLMRIQKCGSPTGMAHVFEIDRKDLISAQKLGFKEWTQGLE